MSETVEAKITYEQLANAIESWFNDETLGHLDEFISHLRMYADLSLLVEAEQEEDWYKDMFLPDIFKEVIGTAIDSIEKYVRENTETYEDAIDSIHHSMPPTFAGEYYENIHYALAKYVASRLDKEVSALEYIVDHATIAKNEEEAKKIKEQLKTLLSAEEEE